jgi:protein SCO1/2
MGVDYSAKDLKLGLVDASGNKIGTLADHVLLYCYHFDPQSAKYTPVALGLLRVAGLATVLIMLGYMVIMLRRESRQKGNRAA